MKNLQNKNYMKKAYIPPRISNNKNIKELNQNSVSVLIKNQIIPKKENKQLKYSRYFQMSDLQPEGCQTSLNPQQNISRSTSDIPSFEIVPTPENNSDSIEDFENCDEGDSFRITLNEELKS